MFTRSIPSWLFPLLLVFQAGHTIASTDPLGPASIGGAQPEPAADFAARRARPWPSPTGPVFVENCGQWDGGGRFTARAGSVLVRAEGSALALCLPGRERDAGAVVRLVFEGARAECTVVGEDPLPGERSFFLGDDPTRWRTQVRSFGRLRYRGLYEGIDLVVRVLPGSLKYDLELAPGADLAQVRLRCEGIDSIADIGGGALRLSLAGGTLEHLPGTTWQVSASGARLGRSCQLLRAGGGRMAIDVPGRDPTLPTVVDPALVWASYLGGSNYNQSPGDIAFGIALHPTNKDVYAVGETEGFDFPQTAGAFQQNSGLGADTFVTRLRAADGALVYSCVIGGSHIQERGLAVDVDGAGRATVVGFTYSNDFPTTPGALDTVKGTIGKTGYALRLSGQGDVLEYSTFLEGTSAGSHAEPFAVDALDSGAAVICGWTGAPDLPFPPGGVDTTVASSEGFVMRLDPTGSFLEWGTFLGGTLADEVHDVAVARDGTVTVCGRTVSADFVTTSGAHDTTPPNGWWRAFVTRLNADGSAILWSTLFGGRQHLFSGDSADYVALLPDGGVVIAGLTDSLDFPYTPGAFQQAVQGSNHNGFVARLDPTGSWLVFATYVTSPAQSWIEGMAVDPGGVVTVLGRLGVAFPTTSGAWAETPRGGGDMVVARLHPSGQSLLYSTFLGGPGFDGPYDLAMAPGGRVAVAGYTFGPGYPTTPGAAGTSYAGGQTDATVTVLDLAPTGTQHFGAATASCRGPLELEATRRPLAGSVDFRLWCSGAAPHARGWLLAGFPARTPRTVRGAQLWIAPSPRLVRVPLVANADGFAEVGLPLANLPPGLEFAVQCVFFGTATCGGPGTLAASQGLLVRVQ